METSDADFSEVNRINFPAGKDTSRNQIYAPWGIVPGQSVNFHELTGEIDEVCEDVIGWLEYLPYREAITDLIRKSYYPGRLMPEAFMELMTGLFGSMGLVMINPLHSAVVARTVEFWDRSLRKPDNLNKSFLISSSELTRLRFPLQVRLRNDALPILHIDDTGVRRRIRGQTDAWKPIQGKTTHDDEQLRTMAVEYPETFTPSALLRPVLQDWLLPTWIYVGGPSEVAYHAQIGRCYDLLDIPRPLFAPRISVTIVEPATRRLLDRNGWTVKDAIGGREILLRSSGKPAVLADLLDRGFEQLESWIKRIEQTAEEAEVSISSEIDNISRKLKYQWEKLERITLNKIAERDKVRVNHSDRIQSMLMPDNLLQERHDNALYYLASYGDKLVRIISEEADLFQSQHLVVELEAE